MNPRTGALASSAAVAAGYWTFLSPTSQLFGSFPADVSTDQPVIALTFDDGPNEPYTSRIADVLAAEEVPATFFCVGTCVRRHPRTIQRLVEDGHAVGNHSENHLARRYLTDPSFRTEISTAQTTIEDATGTRPTLFRPPWLFRHPLLLRTVRDLRLQVVSGRFAHPLEPLQPPPGSVVTNALRTVGPGRIVILHDGIEGRGGDRTATAAAVGPLIRRLRDDGYHFARVDDLLGVPRSTRP